MRKNHRQDSCRKWTVWRLDYSPVHRGKRFTGLFGHTAIRVHDAATGQDVAVNYGLFNYHTPYFIPRFVFGLCDYEMGIYPFDLFMEEYTEEGRGVIEQRINLTRQEKLDIINALALNARLARTRYTVTISSMTIVRQEHVT